jgi:hypothetical protein
MPPLSQTRRHSNRAVLHVHPRAWGTKHVRSSAHCVLSLDNLSCKAIHHTLYRQPPVSIHADHSSDVYSDVVYDVVELADQVIAVALP